MPTTIKLRNSVTTTSAPSSLVQGEVAINITDKKVWVGNAATTPIQLLGDGGSGSFTSIAFGAGTVSSPSITFTGDTNTGIYSPAADTIAFTEGGVESMRIDSSGNVGIGTNSPTDRLVVSTGAYTIGKIESTLASSSRAYWQFNAKDTSAASMEAYVGWFGDGLNTFDVRTGTSHPIRFATNNTERMRIDSSGNVGIGTASPNIASGFTNFVVSDTDNGGIVYVDRAGGARGYFYANGTSSVVLGNTSSIPLVFNTADTERMRIDSSGNVGIGTSSFGFANTGRGLLEINGSTDSLIALKSNNANQMYFYASTSIAQINATSNIPLVFYTDSAERLRIEAAGNILFGLTAGTATSPTNGASCVRIDSRGTYWINATTATGAWNQFTFVNGNGSVGAIQTNGTSTSYFTSSDYRLKENIAPMTGALAKVAQLKPVTYTWKADGSDGQGFIAHELQALVPDCVTGEKDAVDEEGKPVYQGVDTSFLVATLTAAIQEQQAMIEELKQEVAKLKGV